MMLRFAFLIALLVCPSVCGRLYAQESLLPLPVETTGADAAMAKAEREHRVLIVVHEWKRPPFGRRPWWMNDSVRAWLKWHAVLVECKPGDPESREYLQRYPRKADSYLWGFDIIINKARRTPLNPPPPGIANARDRDDHEPTGIGLSATYVLYRLNLDLEMVQGNSPVWSAAHELNCPEPKRPERQYTYSDTTDGFPAAADDASPRSGERYVDVMAHVQEADKALVAGDRKKAFALLTWAWERGPELDPAFGLARVGLVLPRMAAIRKAESALTARMVQVGEAELGLYPWFDDDEELAYLCLRYNAGESDKVIGRSVVENVDVDEQTMGGLVTARLADLKARVTELTLKPVVSASDWTSLVKTARLGVPAYMERDIKERWVRARVQLLAAAGIRTYTTLLASEDPNERARAERVAHDIVQLSASAPAAVRASVLRSLVMAAVSVGKADSRHAEWLAEAGRLAPPPSGSKTAATDPLVRHIGQAAR